MEDDYIQEHYDKIKTFFLLDDFSRAKKEEEVCTRINDKIFLGSKNTEIKTDAVISLVKREVTCPQLLIEIDDLPYHPSLQIFDRQSTMDLAKLLISKLNEAYTYIKNNKTVLIHCKKGMSRVSLVYLYYELKEHYMHENNSKSILFELIQLLKAKRTRCMMADGFIFLLCYIQFLFIKGGPTNEASSTTETNNTPSQLSPKSSEDK